VLHFEGKQIRCEILSQDTLAGFLYHLICDNSRQNQNKVFTLCGFCSNNYRSRRIDVYLYGIVVNVLCSKIFVFYSLGLCFVRVLKITLIFMRDMIWVSPLDKNLLVLSPSPKGGECKCSLLDLYNYSELAYWSLF